VHIVSDISILRTKSENVVSVEEAKSLITQLESALEKTSNGVGLAAIQLGIPKKVGVIKRSDKCLYLINAEIIDKSEEFVYYNEGCLSYEGVFLNTKRYKQITVKHNIIVNDKFEEEVFVAYFSLDEKEIGNDGIIAIAIQHEIDHFNGLTIYDHNIISKPLTRDNIKIGRNDPCVCGSGKKYKKCCLKE
jgi:peptide deformylase